MRLAKAALRYVRAQYRFGYPLQVGFAVNNKCNTFCQMCNVWKMRPKSELSIDEIESAFSKKLFRHCATVSLTGGEPTMRKDLHAILPLLVHVLPNLRQINLTSNGYATEKLEADLIHFLPILQRHRIGFSINLSIDGIGEAHNKIRGNEHAFENLNNTVNSLLRIKRQIAFNMVLACTLSQNNADQALPVLEYAKSKSLYAIFRNATVIDRIGNAESNEFFKLNESQILQLRKFYQRLISHEVQSISRQKYYRMLVAMIDGRERSIPCLYRKAGLFVDHCGDMFVCTVHSKCIGNILASDAETSYWNSLKHRNELALKQCAGCSHDVSLFTPVAVQLGDRITSAWTGAKR